MKQPQTKKTILVRNVEHLLSLFVNVNEDGLYHVITEFFAQQTATQQALKLAESKWQQASQQQEKPEVIQKYRKAFIELQYQDERSRISRWVKLHSIVDKLLELSEGKTLADSQTFSSRLLGTLLLTALNKQQKYWLMEAAYKPCYRAVVTLRLVEDLLEQKIIKDSRWQDWFSNRNPAEPAQCPYRQQIQIPIVLACLLQHFGQFDPAAQSILTADGTLTVNNRTLTSEERQTFNERCRVASGHILQYGLGQVPFKGNDRNAREQHIQQQQQLLQQLQQFIVAAPESILGGLFKVPHAYSSLVLPGRTRYNYDAIPRAAVLMRDAAKRGDYNAVLVDRMFRIMGFFPQGYGIVFTPLGDDGKPQLKYEFAIVNALYPDKPEHPICRVVSRNQQYRNTGINIMLSTELNLYFKPARDRLSSLSETRLRELLNMLFQDGEQKYLSKLMPKCWQADSFFSVAEHQNLWQLAQQRQN